MIDSFLALPAIYQIICIISLVLVIQLNLTVIINVIFGPMLETKGNIELFPKVSILVPARNEERNIDICIKSLLNQDYPNYELIILDDNSIDNTLKICKKFENLPNYRIIKGLSLPNDWLGKNWACHQLANQSNGEILIFTDADNFHHQNSVRNTVQYFQKYKLGMMSAFPQQITNTFSEKLIVPIIDLLIYSGLILWTTYKLKNKLFAAANGQWIAFTRDTYFKIGGHQAVKNKIVEDLSLSRLAKSCGIKTMTTSGTGVVFGKMYNNFTEIWNGLSKNIYGLTDYKPIPFILLLIIVIICGILPYLYLFHSELYYFAVIIVVLNIFGRILLAYKYKHNYFVAVIFHPISLLLLVLIGVNSYYKSSYGKLKWKDREINIKKEFK